MGGAGADAALIERKRSDGDLGSGGSGANANAGKRGRPASCGAAVMGLLALLCLWSYLDVVRERQAIAGEGVDMFVRVHRVTTARTRHMEEIADDDGAYVNFTKLIGAAVADPHRSTSALPRTSLRPYNLLEAGEKYVLYSPSGGFTNQLYCFLSAAYLAKESNRTLLVPPKGRHSNMFWGYYSLKQPEVVPMDHALDFEYMERMMGVRLQPINITLKEFHTSALGGAHDSTDQLDIQRIKIKGGLRHASHDYSDKYARRLAGSRKQVVWAYGKFYNKYMAAKGGLQRHVRFAPYIREFAQTISREVFNETYNAFHIRLGDYSKKAKSVSSDARAFAKTAKRMDFARDVPVYLATDSTSRLYFKPIWRHWHKVVRAKDLAENPVVREWLKDFYTRLPSTTIRSSLFGLVDQLVCVRAQKFVGTSISTFSKIIVAQRKNLRTVAPDLARKVNQTGVVQLERRQDLTWWGAASSGAGKL